MIAVLAIALVAPIVLARRASRVDPMVALRSFPRMPTSARVNAWDVISTVGNPTTIRGRSASAIPERRTSAS
jgi:hypothetical protein